MSPVQGKAARCPVCRGETEKPSEPCGSCKAWDAILRSLELSRDLLARART